MKYKKIVIDIETTGLSSTYDEILQISIIDQDGNILINEYCKPKVVDNWEEAQTINKISPEMVKDKKPFEEYVDLVSNILSNSEKIIIYNAEFELSFLKKYGIEVKSCICDLMLDFAEVYGQWNEYHGNFTWQPLSTCCRYYGYDLSNAHNSLEDCKATLYCYYKVINGEGRYEAKEYVGKTVKEFLKETLNKTNDKSIESLKVYPNNRICIKPYISAKVSSYEDIKYPELLNRKISYINYISPRHFTIYVDNFIEGDFDLLKGEMEKVKKLNAKLESENNKLAKVKFENYRLYIEENEKVRKLQKQLSKLKEKLGLVLRKEKTVSMYNSYGFYTAEYCKSTRKPMFKSNSEYSPFSDKLLSKTRCKAIKMPVKENEEIYAFYRVKNGYCPLYFRDTKGENNDKN